MFIRAGIRIATLILAPMLASSALAEGDESPPVTAAEIFSLHAQRFAALESLYAESVKANIYGESVPVESWDLSKGAEYIAGKADSTLRSTRFHFKGEFYRSSYELALTGSDTQRCDVVYNGTHQNYYREARELIVRGKSKGSKRQPYYVAPAFLEPYEFAFYDLEKTRTFPVLRDPKTWQNLADAATVVGTREVDGHPCIVVDIKVPGNVRGDLAVMSRVCFATDLEYFPIQTEFFQTESGYRYRYYRAWGFAYIKDATGAGMYVNQLVLRRAWDWAGSGKVAGGFLAETDLGTIELNPDIPDSLFTVPLTDVLVYNNELDPSLNFSRKSQSKDAVSESTVQSLNG